MPGKVMPARKPIRDYTIAMIAEFRCVGVEVVRDEQPLGEFDQDAIALVCVERGLMNPCTSPMTVGEVIKQLEQQELTG